MCRFVGQVPDIVQSKALSRRGREIQRAASSSSHVCQIVKFARLPLENTSASRAANQSIFELLIDVLCTLCYLQIKLHDLGNLANTAKYLMPWMNTKLAAKSQDHHLE